MSLLCRDIKITNDNNDKIAMINCNCSFLKQLNDVNLHNILLFESFIVLTTND